MKKQILAAAVATAIVAPMTAAADVTVYGKLHYTISSEDRNANMAGSDDIAGTGADTHSANWDGLAVNDHASRFGIKGSEDLGNGLSAVFQMEFAVDADDNSLSESNNDVGSTRNAYFALAGSWGVAGVGRVDTPYKSSTGSLELFGDTYGDYNQLFMDDIRAPDALFYMSPNWNGFSFVAAVVAPSDNNNNNVDGIEAFSASASYANGPWFATLAYESLTNEWVNTLHAVDEDYDKWRLGLGYTANAFHVGFIYEDRDLENTLDGDSWQLSASYTFGNNTLKAAYGEAEGFVRTSDYGISGTQIDDSEQITIGLDHKLSSRTKVYAVYSDQEIDDGAVDREWDALAIGVIHKF